jgi:hypothetical protein
MIRFGVADPSHRGMGELTRIVDSAHTVARGRLDSIAPDRRRMRPDASPELCGCGAPGNAARPAITSSSAHLEVPFNEGSR